MNKMIEKKFILYLILGVFLVSFLPIISSVEVSYCCERLKGTEVWCQNALEDQCDEGYRRTPTSCEATSYCKLGTCINLKQGVCMENTAEATCQEKGGFWKNKSSEEIIQCKLGCCLIGDQAAFVTQTRCKSLSLQYGLNTQFRTDIQNEIQCITTANPDVKGACVFEKEFEKTCRFTTKKECQNFETITPNSILDSFSSQGDPILRVTFHQDRLCSDETLETNCARTQKTTCVKDRDEVYFLDSCGNLANIYDAIKVNDVNYWKNVISSTQSCNLTSSNTGT